ncbi:MAG TPA: hypothetical protein P5147_03820 [Myxococcota bacterium]|nr:hypothetical protein [Myxococcota bacterium]
MHPSLSPCPALRSLGPLAVGLLALGLPTGCDTGAQLSTICRGDEDCPPGYRCELSTGLCLCASDEVCGPDEYCAPDGRCRRRMACDTNLDCPLGTFCDSTTGNCIEQDKCTDDKQCPLGQICSEVTFRCAPGCRQNGDCPLGDVCREGACRGGLCEDTSYCAYGELCEPASQTCSSPYDDELAPFCAPCRPTSVSEPNRCGPGPNFCIMTGNDPSLAPFCGVDCSQGQECPNGYGCHLILTAPDGSCQADGECPSGSCHINEGDTVGFCLCATDAECPQDACDDFAFECRLTRRPCSPGGAECDRPIYCIEGLCLLGRNCAPVEGLRCADLTGGVAP